MTEEMIGMSHDFFYN